MINLKYICCIAFICLLCACNRSGKTDQDRNVRIIASAGNETLSEDQFKDKFISTGIIKDSVYNSRRSIENWATESLFYQEALSKLEEDEIDIDQQVQDYKKTLVNYIYQTRLIDANIDTSISEKEIREYYELHRESFILKENIIKVNYIKIQARAQGLEKIKRLLGSSKPKEKEQLMSLLVQNAENFFMNDSTWLFLDDIKKEIPKLKELPDFNLSAGRIVEFTDDLYYYYLKVKDVKIKNGLSPINFERKNIRKFIINNRKTQLIHQYKQLLLEKARANKTFIIK